MKCVVSALCGATGAVFTDSCTTKTGDSLKYLSTDLQNVNGFGLKGGNNSITAVTTIIINAVGHVYFTDGVSNSIISLSINLLITFLINQRVVRSEKGESARSVFPKSLR